MKDLVLLGYMFFDPFLNWMMQGFGEELLRYFGTEENLTDTINWHVSKQLCLLANCTAKFPQNC